VAWTASERRGLEIVEAARALAPAIRAEAPAIERERRLSDALLAAMKRAGVFRMTMPRALGGPEADPLTQIEVIEALSEADGSVGWIAMIGSDGGYFSAWLGEEVANELYADRDAITAGTLAPHGRAQRVPGGYRVSGRWPFASASVHAEWIGCGCLVYEDDAPAKDAHDAPVVRSALLPAAACEILDTWHATGLEGSGSHDFVVRETFVPERHTFSLLHDPPRIDAPLYRFPWMVLVNAPGVPLGIARGALGALRELAATKVTMPSGRLLREDPLVQAAYARAETLVGSARSYLFEAVGALWDTLVAGRPLSLDARVEFRLATIHAFRASREAVQSLYECGGGSALYRSSPLDRQLRDVTTIAQHALVNARGLLEMGRARLGLDPGTFLL
jgi:alkylation response protein AidB-like acyl-CoA dehydrogenase